MPRRFAYLFAVSVICVLAAATGCSLDFDDLRGPGQSCSADEDCADGLVCVERVCRHGGVEIEPDPDIPDAGGPDTPPPSDVPSSDAPVSDVPIIVDTGVDAGNGHCTPGQTRCGEGERRIERCIAPDGVDPYWTGSNCPPNHRCEDGHCVDESPQPECCPGGCADGEICSDCTCQPYDPSTCAYQNQPCENEGQITDNFVCSDFGETGQLRCIGLCSPGAENPDETCPGSDGICFFESTAQPNGFCLSNCSIGDNCGDESMACAYNSAGYDDGLCYPVTTPNQPGDPCDANDFFACAGESLCIGGICQQSCRPFDQVDSDCAAGHCLPFDGNMGFCTDDSSIGGGECTAVFTTCGEDATGCFPENGGHVCRDFCRLGLGDIDCEGGSCVRFEQDNEQIGICL